MIDITKLEEIIGKLEQTNGIDPVTLQKLTTTAHQIREATPETLPDKLEKLQELNNFLYNTTPDDLLIDLQVYINSLRNEYDITDPREIIHEDNGRGFVQ